MKDILKGNGKKKEAFNKYINENSFSSKFIDSLMGEQEVTILIRNYTQENKFESAKLIEQRMKRRKTIKTLRKRITVSLFAAASALIVLSFVLRFEPTQEIKHSMPAKVLTPTLTLSDGTNINLEDEKSEPIDGVHIDKEEKKMIVYKATKLMQVSHNVITVPSKYTYNVVLEDGTKVTLNAGSRLKYPTTFSGDRREVYLSGEGYFDVTKSNIPFVVVADNSTVKVYGTQFNINSYNKNKIRTTLIHGLVGVSITGASDASEVMLQPNSMLEMNACGESIVSEINASRSVMWMNGDITSKNEPLEDMLDKISRWYGVKFIYNDKIKDITITATFSNTMNLEKVIESIMLTTDIVIIKQKNGEYMIL